MLASVTPRPIGLTASHIKVSVNESLKAIGKRPYSLWIGMLAEGKSPLEIVEIAKMIPEMNFVMIGWPYDKAIVDRLEKEKTANVLYLGAVSEELKEELIEKCSVGLTTSKYEGFGLTPFEFLRAGKPVLAYPLEVFREVYGDLIIYVVSIDDFVKHLRRMCDKGFFGTVNADAVTKRLVRYDLAQAASRIVRRLGTKSLLIFTEDVSIGRDAIAGYYVLQWRLWKLIKESGVNMHILANGTKFSTEFNLVDRTTQTGSVVEYLRCLMEALNRRNRRGGRVIDLVVRVLEPMCYVYQYIMKRKDMPSRVLIVTGYPRIFGGVIIKYLFGLKLVCLIHDMRLYKYGLVRSSFPVKVYLLALAHVLMHVDLIMLVSDTMRREFLNYYPYEDRLMVIWGEDE